MARGGRWGGAVALAAGLAVVAGLSAVEFTPSEHIWHAAEPPDTADAGDFRVTIEDPAEDVIVMNWVQVGAQSHESEEKLVAMVARYDFLAHDTVINEVRLVSPDGYRYKALSDFSQVHDRLATGFTSSGILVFEAPEDKLEGASVEFCRTSIVTERRPCARLDNVITGETLRHDGGITIERDSLTYEVIEP